MKNLFWTTFRILVFTIVYNNAFSSSDTLVLYEDLKFHSDLEREAFLNYKRNGDFNYFNFFLSIDKEVTKESVKNYKWVFEQKLADIEKSKINKSKPKKKIKSIYSNIHDQLDKYEELALFADIFERQTYQCVTSSMLYALYFDKLNIPYTIEYIPGHVYLTAFPESEKIQIQTTDPLRGVFTYNQQFKANFINHMRDAKRISSEEYNNKTYDELFQEYFLKSESINKKELAGSLYNNLGITYLEKANFLEAYQAYQKSYFLFPIEQTEFFLYISLAALIEQTSATESIYADYLSKYIKLSKNHLNKDLISGLFSNITYKQLITNGNLRQYELSYDKIISAVTDSSLYEEIAFIYHSEMGHIMLKRELLSTAQNHYKEALKLKENNYDIQNLLVGAIINEMNLLRGDVVKTKEFQAKISSIWDSIPSVRNNKKIMDLRLETALFLMKYHFQDKDLDEAIKQKQLFQSMADKYDGNFSYIIENEIEGAYSAAAVYYYKNNQTKNALNTISEGLKYCPNNNRLKLRLEALK